MNRTIALISLGCAKNLVKSEQILYLVNEAGYAIAPEPDGADAVIINTCGFIDAAKAEAIDNILQMAELKKEGRLKKIIVTGCLTQRYGKEVTEEIPEIDAMIGATNLGDIIQVLDACFNDEEAISLGDINEPVEEIGRIITTGPAWTYLRIAEGCNNYCAFCAIPYITGKYRSRPIENIIEEAKEFAEHGVKELIVIAQDLTRYGMDLYKERSLTRLIRELSKIEGIEWIRLHYLYPEAFDDELINEIATNNKVVKYLDIPIQHINDSILKKMNRHTNGKQIRELFAKLRKEIPGLVIRTSLITGLPGEGEEEFEELCAFLKEAKIERAGVFPFSPEEGTPAATMEHVDEETAQKRADFVMDIQAQIMDDFCDSIIGKTIPVLYENFDEEYNAKIGRSYMDSPDIDGIVIINGECNEGDIVNVKITGVEDGNLTGDVL